MALSTCSTPVGVKDRFTIAFVGQNGSEECSTPVGVKDRFTSLAPKAAASVQRVLNACRRQRSVHCAGDLQLHVSSRVLNACRRQRSVHLVTSGRSEWLRSAQRLSASKIGSHGIWPGHCAGKMCSTPVGVKDRFTTNNTTYPLIWACAQRLSASKIGSLAWVAEDEAVAAVLNACRRQRSVHSRLLNTVWYSGRAQRLSASKIGSRAGS